MMTVNLIFTPAEAAAVFENAGLTVEMHDFEIQFPAPNNQIETELIPMQSVVNPFTGKHELLSTLFVKFLENRKSELFLTPEKLEVYNLFKNQIK
jgi:hypothetical protein